MRKSNFKCDYCEKEHDKPLMCEGDGFRYCNDECRQKKWFEAASENHFKSLKRLDGRCRFCHKPSDKEMCNDKCEAFYYISELRYIFQFLEWDTFLKNGKVFETIKDLSGLLNQVMERIDENNRTVL